MQLAHHLVRPRQECLRLVRQRGFGEQLASALETAVEEIRREAVPVLNKLGAGLDTWTVLGSNLITSRERLDQLIVRVDSLATDLHQGKGTAGKLLTDTAVADEAQALLARANAAMNEWRDVVTNLKVAVKNVQTGTARLPEITDAVANEAKDLPGLVQQTQISMREIERLVEAMERHWLLRKYVNKTNPPPLRPLPGGEEPAPKPILRFKSPKDAGR